jgi:hypothetical protein
MNQPKYITYMNQPKYITYKGTKYQRVDTLSEIVVQPRLRISDITLANHRPSDEAFIALGHNFQVKLNNGTTVEATEDKLLGRYWETIPAIRKRKTPKELAALLKNKVWDEEY